MLVVFDTDAVVAEDDGLFDALAWVLVRPDAARLLLGGGVEGRITVNGVLERAVFTFDNSGFRLGERVAFDPHRGGDFALHRYRPVCAWISLDGLTRHFTR